MNSKNILALTVLSLMFSSCSVKVGEVEEESTPPPTLDGTWATSCIVDGADSYLKSFQLEAGTLTVATLRYKTSNTCEQAKLSTTVLMSGKFAVTGDGAAEDVKNYELEIEMIVGIVNDQAMVDDLNAGSVCGTNAWAIGQAQILLGCQVAPGFDLSNVAYGTKHYGAYEIQEDVTPLYMQFESSCAIAGYNDFCPTAGARPGTFDGTVLFKQ